MSASTFINAYFPFWNVVSVSTFGTETGFLNLQNGKYFLKVFLNMNGEHNWKGKNVTIAHIEPVFA